LIRAKQTESELRRELVKFGQWLSRLGFTPGTSGNLSVRLDEHRFLATPTGMSKYLVEEDDMVIVNHDGELLEGTRRATSEISMHLAVYRHRPDIRAVIHSHPPIATACACTGRALDQPLCQEAVMTLGVVPLASYATTGTDEVATSLVPFIPGHEAILMANHGVVTYGGSLLEAFLRMETVEHLAHVTLVAHQLGSPRLLTSGEIQQLRDAKSKYERNSNPESPNARPVDRANALSCASNGHSVKSGVVA